MSDKVLIIEDERDLADILGDYLKVEGMETGIAYDGAEGLRLYESFGPSIVLLDIMLPKINGIDVCRKIRENSLVPIIMISAKNGDMDKVIALGVGADDYVTKPFSPVELVARVKAQLRRFRMGSIGEKKENDIITVGALSLNRLSYAVKTSAETLALTTREFEVLFYLASNQNQVFSKEQIYQAVWGYESIADDNSVTVYIKRIREKLMQVQCDYIKTVWGAGYKFSVD